MKQTSFFKEKISAQFGGELLVGKRKSARPLATKSPIHLVLRASSNKLQKHETQIYKILNRYSKKIDVRIYERSVNTTHIHLIVKIHSRDSYRFFVRAICGRIGQCFSVNWTHRPFTRIASWGRGFEILKDYIFKNQLEASGVISFKPKVISS